MKLPKNTCPDIDRVLKAINTAIELCDCELDTDNFNEIDRAIRILNDIASELHGMDSILECIREANSTLRGAAEHYMDAFDELESQNIDLKEDREDDMFRIRELEQRIENMESQAYATEIANARHD